VVLGTVVGVVVVGEVVGVVELVDVVELLELVAADEGFCDEHAPRHSPDATKNTKAT
jgi:hypothetical protein